jgi:hypothetical protein
VNLHWRRVVNTDKKRGDFSQSKGALLSEQNLALFLRLTQ